MQRVAESCRELQRDAESDTMVITITQVVALARKAMTDLLLPPRSLFSHITGQAYS